MNHHKQIVTVGLCVSLLLSCGQVLSHQNPEIFLLEEVLSLCTTSEEQDAVIRVFLNKYPSIEEQMTSKGSINSCTRFVECGTPDVMTLLEVASRLNEETREEVLRTIGEPPDLGRQAQVKTITNFKIHYTLEEGHIHETTLDFVNKIAKGFESSFTILRGFGYCATEKPTSRPLYNDGFYHVFVVSLGSAGAVEPTKTLEGSIIFIGTVLEFSDESRILSLCGHEYYHAIQTTYIKSYTIGADGNLVWYPQVKRWVDEGTAEWVEHEIFRTQFPDGDWKQHDQVSEFQENVNDYLEKPYKGLESWKHGALPLWFFMANNSRINFKGGGQQRDLILDFWNLTGYDFHKLTGYAAWGNVYENLDIILRGI